MSECHVAVTALATALGLTIAAVVKLAGDVAKLKIKTQDFTDELPKPHYRRKRERAEDDEQ